MIREYLWWVAWYALLAILVLPMAWLAIKWIAFCVDSDIPGWITIPVGMLGIIMYCVAIGMLLT